MRIKKYNYGDYFQKLFVEEGKILDAECICIWAKNNQKAWKNGDKLCKHLVCAIREFYLEIRNNKKDKIMTGPTKLTIEVKRAVEKRSNGICELKTCKELANEFHRIIRGNKNGKYILSNIKHICLDHHKQIHFEEFK